MNSRERMLAIGVGLLAIVWVAMMGVSGFQEARERNQRTLKNTKKALVKAQEAAERGHKAQSQILKWAKQSLPTDTDIAKSLYEDWLREQLTASGLTVNEIDDKSPGGAKKRFEEISFLVSAEGSLDQLSDFLYGFYQAGHLHRVSEANISPNKEETALKISLTIDALSLNDCKRTESLSERPSELPLPPLEELREAIVSRNIFSVYQLNKRQTPDALDPVLAQARITSMLKGRGGWRMTIHRGDNGSILYFREGDSIEIGQFSGQVTQLDGRRAVVTVRNQQMLVNLGEYLSQAQPL